jgi:hypothetical protein
MGIASMVLNGVSPVEIGVEEARGAAQGRQWPESVVLEF